MYHIISLLESTLGYNINFSNSVRNLHVHTLLGSIFRNCYLFGRWVVLYNSMTKCSFICTYNNVLIKNIYMNKCCFCSLHERKVGISKHVWGCVWVWLEIWWICKTNGTTWPIILSVGLGSETNGRLWTYADDHRSLMFLI